MSPSNRFAPHGQQLTPYQKIVRAGKRGSGVRLTVADVDRLNRDTAILFRADLDDLELTSEVDQAERILPKKRARR